MSLNRNVFLENIGKDIAQLNIVFLNHSGAPSTLVSDLAAIEVLIDYESKEKFKQYILSHPLVNELIILPDFQHSKLIVKFKDGSQIYFKTVTNVIYKALLCLPVKDIFNAANCNIHEMKVPSFHHHFEYLLQQHQFLGLPFPDKFQKYFSSLDGPARISILRYIKSKYNLVFNVIEDLYKPKGGVQLKLIIGLRKLPNNTLLKMFARFVHRSFWNIGTVFFKSEIKIIAKHSGNAPTQQPLSKKPAGQIVW